MALYLRQSTQVVEMIGPFLDIADGVTEEVGLAGNGTELTKNGAAYAAGPVLGTHDSEGWYPVTLTTTHTNTVGTLKLKSHAPATHLPVWHEWQVLEEAIYDAMFAASANAWSGAAGSSIGVANATQFAGQTITAAAGVTIPSTIASPTNITAGTITTVTNLTNAPTAGDLTATMKASVNTEADTALADAKAGYVTAIWDALTSALTTVGSIGKLLVDNINATISSRSSHTAANVRTEMDANSTQLAAIVADTNELQADWANGGRLDLILDARASQASVDTIDGIVDDILLDTAEIGAAGAGLTEAGGTGDQLTALATQASVNTIDDLLDTEVAALTTELAKVPKSDGTASWNATALAAIQSECNDALVAYDPPTNAEMEARTIAAASYSTVTTAQVNAEVVDALATDTYAEAAAVPAATSSLKDKINWLFALARNKLTQTSTTQTLRNDADNASIATSTVSDDGTTTTRGEWS